MNRPLVKLKDIPLIASLCFEVVSHNQEMPTYQRSSTESCASIHPCVPFVPQSRAYMTFMNPEGDHSLL